MRAVNVDGVELVLSLAAEAGVERVVYTSSTTAIGDTAGAVVDEHFERVAPPYSWYEATKAEAHQLARRHQRAGEPVVIAAPAQIVGPGDHSPFGIMGRLFLRRRLPPVAWGPDGAFTFGHVEDVAEAILRLGENGRTGEVYFLAGETLTVRELAGVWKDIERRTPFWLWLPRPLALTQGALLAPLLRWLRQPAFLSPEVVRSGYASFRYRSDKAITELGVELRPAAQAWADTFEAERKLIRPGPPAARR
jgi:nucleoside-diphosphate-sugar epimerase